MNRRPWKTLLVIIADPFAKDQPALTKAVALSLRTGARLVLFNSVMLPQPVNDVGASHRSSRLRPPGDQGCVVQRTSAETERKAACNHAR